MSTNLEGKESANETPPSLPVDRDLAGEPLEGSGFEEEVPDRDFEWRS